MCRSGLVISKTFGSMIGNLGVAWWSSHVKDIWLQDKGIYVWRGCLVISKTFGSMIRESMSGVVVQSYQRHLAL